MAIRGIDVPSAWQTAEPKTREDFRRLRVALEQLNKQMLDLQTQIDVNAAAAGDITSVTAGTGLTGGAASGDATLAADFGSGAGKVTEGNDSRLSDARLPLYPSEFWQRPATAHAYDVEGDSSTLPSSFTLWDCTAGPGTVSPSSGIDIWTQPAAGACRIEANKANRRSWLLFQPRGENRRWMYARQMTLSGTNGWVFRSRISTITLVNSVTNDAQSIRMCLFKDDGANKPNVAVQNGWQIGWEADANTMNIQSDVWKNGVATGITRGDFDAATATFDVELAVVLLSGAASNNWAMFLRAGNYTWYTHAATSADIGVVQGDTVWVGWEFNGISSNIPSAPIMGADYFRFEDTAANFLP